MAFASLERGRGNAPMSDINMVPLIDVMLVLLVIFILCAPLLAQSVRLELPRADATAEREPQPPWVVSIDARGGLHLNGEPLGREALRQRLQDAATQPRPPLLALEADQAVAYRVVAEVMADAAGAGLHRIGFRSQPAGP